MFILRQSTAVDVLIGPFVDGTDGATPEEALSPSVQVSKNGQTAATKSDVTTPTHDNAGYYNCEFDATDTGTVGQLVAFVEGAPGTHLAVRHEFQIMDTAAFDALFADGAEGPLQATTVGNTLDVSAGGEAGLDWANIGSPTTAQNLSGTNIDVDQVVASVSGAVASVTAGVSLGAGAVTDASLAGGLEIVFETDFATNYNVTRNAWATNVQDFVGTSATDPFNGQVVSASVTGAVGSVTGAVGSVAGNVDGNVTGSVGSISGITFPTNFADLAITITTGLVSVGTNNDKTGYALTTADWNVGKTGYTLTATTGLGNQTANITGNLSGTVGSVTGSVGSNVELGPAEVNAEMVDVLFTDTDAEPVKGAPGATISLADKIGFLYKAWRNRSTQTATVYSLYNDDATTVDHDATVSDDTTTADRGEMTDGP